jgi:hypothetical protein
MARRPDFRIDEILSRDELIQIRDNLAQMGIDVVRQAYHTAHTRCRMVNDRIPSVRCIQKLVQTWKALRILQKTRK